MTAVVVQSTSASPQEQPNANNIAKSSNGANNSQQAHQMDANVTLWQFLLDLLLSGEHTDLIQWTNSEGEFKLLNAESVAHLWGTRKNKPHMNYDKLSRALRYYYDKNIIKKVIGQKFVYRFVSFPENPQSDQLAYAVGRVNAAQNGSMTPFQNLTSEALHCAIHPVSPSSTFETTPTSVSSTTNVAVPNASTGSSPRASSSPSSLGSDGRNSAPSIGTKRKSTENTIFRQGRRVRSKPEPLDLTTLTSEQQHQQLSDPQRQQQQHLQQQQFCNNAFLLRQQQQQQQQQCVSPFMQHQLHQLYTAALASASFVSNSPLTFSPSFMPNSPLGSVLKPAHFQFPTTTTASQPPPPPSASVSSIPPPQLSPATVAAAASILRTSPALAGIFGAAALALANGTVSPFSTNSFPAQRRSAFVLPTSTATTGVSPDSGAGELKTPVSAQGLDDRQG